MKKSYKMPEIQVMEMVSKACLLNGSNTATNAGFMINVDDWGDEE